MRNWLHFQKLSFKTDILVGGGGKRSQMCLPRPRVFEVHPFSFSCYSFLSALSYSYLFSSHSHFVILLHSALSLPVSCSDVLQVSLRRLFPALVCVSFLPLWARVFRREVCGAVGSHTEFLTPSVTPLFAWAELGLLGPDEGREYARWVSALRTDT